VYVSGTTAYVAARNRGLRVVDVSEPLPLNPPQIGWYDTPGDSLGVHVSGGLVYVADGDGGLVILRYTGATTEDP
jgi:hypothetical protein